MKKLICLLCALLLLAATPAALAGEGTTAGENWYELSDEDRVVTVRLPSNELSGLAWAYEISAPESMELITEETIEGEDRGVGGAPNTFVASFRATGGEGDHVSLIFRLTAEGEEAPAMTYILETTQDGAGRLTLNSVYEQTPFDDWCEMSEDNEALILRLPANATTGYKWSYEILDPVIECMNSDYIPDKVEGDLTGVGGSYVASFSAVKDQTGTSEINLTYARGVDEVAETRSVTVTADADGKLLVDRVSTLRIFSAAK